MISSVKHFFEKQFFGVSSWWGSRLGIKPSYIRLFFIYFSFVTFGTPLVYLSMVFVLKIINNLKYLKMTILIDL